LKISIDDLKGNFIEIEKKINIQKRGIINNSINLSIPILNIAF
jgi:hypothetical protein